MSTASSNLRLKGWLLAAAGMLFVSTDSLFVRLGEGSGATMAFLMACGSTLSLSAVAITRPRGVEVARQSMAAAPLAVLLIAMLGAATQFCFIVAVTQTSVANVVVIVGASPIAAAIAGFSCCASAPNVECCGPSSSLRSESGRRCRARSARRHSVVTLLLLLLSAPLGYRSSCGGSTPGSIDHPRWRPVLQ